MGQTTSNIGIYIPGNGETLYGDSFAAGMINVDQHDHSGAPTKGVPLSASGLADFSVTARKLNNTGVTAVVDITTGLGFNASNQIKTVGLLNSLNLVSTAGYLSQNGSGSAVSRSITGTSGEIDVTNGTGFAGNTNLSLSSTTKNKIPSIINIQTITTTGTYTPTSGMIYCIIEVVGGGGGGGGAATTSAAGNGSGASGGGGGAGGYSRGKFTATDIGASKAVTIGAAGTGGTAGANAGVAGGTTSVGATLIQSTGGTGGDGGSAGVTNASYGGAGGVGTLGEFNITGNFGGTGWTDNITGSNLVLAGMGGSAYFGGGNYQDWLNNTGQTAGIAAISYGNGGSGGIALKGGTQVAGGDGAPGVVVITEYCHA
jgi:hypothetical protein